LKQGLISNGFSNIQLVASDSDWKIAEDILKDPSVAKAVDIIGYKRVKCSHLRLS
jgi:hypothetical protein